MSIDTTDRNMRLMQTLDEVLDSLKFDATDSVKIMRIADDREVVVVQPNRFTVSRIYVSGRPDGKKPHGKNSYYDYFQEQIAAYQREHGNDEGFQLTTEDWRAMFDESYDRYTRYLLFAGIKRWDDVKHDTDTNIAVTNMARKYAPADIAWESYQYKGYMLMMNSIAAAELSLRADNREEALNQVDQGIQQIGQFCGECLREGRGAAENTTRESYLSNLIEFRADLESVEGALERARDRHEEEGESEHHMDILDEVEELLRDTDET